MSTMEMAINILKNMDEIQLQGFVDMFKGLVPTGNTFEEESKEQAKCETAFNEILSLCKPVPDLDEKAELAEWRKEKFGI